MTIELADFQPLLHRDGPISVVDQHGNAVTRGASGIAKAVDADIRQVLTLEEIHLVLMDEMTRPIRAIRGDRIEKINRTSPGWEVVVDDTVEPDEGVTVSTRGS